MKIIIKNKEAIEYADELWHDPKISGKGLVRLVNLKFGEGTAIRRKHTSKEWVDYYKFWLDKNIKADAPILIIKKLEKRLEYWKKRSHN